MCLVCLHALKLHSWAAAEVMGSVLVQHHAPRVCCCFCNAGRMSLNCIFAASQGSNRIKGVEGHALSQKCKLFAKP